MIIATDASFDEFAESVNDFDKIINEEYKGIEEEIKKILLIYLKRLA